MNEPTHLDLFSGIGGFALAAGWAGFQTIGFSEIDPYCSAVLKKHWPHVINYGDVRTVPAIGCDLLTGGFPGAGKRLAGKADRHLWPAMLEVIRRCGPAWVVGENVPGIIGMALDDLCADLEAAGYTVQPFVIPACAVDARHRRDRLWIVGHARSVRCEDSGRLLNGLCESSRSKNGMGRREGSGTSAVAHANYSRPQGRNGGKLPERSGQRIAESRQEHCQWLAEPDVGRVAHGVPARVDRLRALGNAIVPQTVYPILKAIRDRSKARVGTRRDYRSNKNGAEPDAAGKARWAKLL